MLADPYPVVPWSNPCSGEIRLPGSKSLTNRALILAALCEGAVRLDGALFSRDTRIMVTALQELGFDVEPYEELETIRIQGMKGMIPNDSATLYVGNAGTAARFLTAFVCLHPNGRFTIDGDEEMHIRPMAGLLEALEDQGARFTFHGKPGCIPFDVQTSGLQGGRWRVDASTSSQMLSAMMMVAPLAKHPVRIDCPNVRPAFVNMTAGIMRQWGAILAGTPAEGFDLRANQTYRVPGGGFFTIEPDVTAASYFMTLPAVVGGELHVLGFQQNMLQGDKAFASVLRQIGVGIQQTNKGLLVRKSQPFSAGQQHFDFSSFSDTFLTLAAIAPLLPSPITIGGIGHTRFQETDRIHGMTTELMKIGARVIERDASLAIYPFEDIPRSPDTPVTIETYKDHRMAMSFAILGCSNRFGTRPWLQIADPGCCGKTFPRFFEEVEKLYRLNHDK